MKKLLLLQLIWVAFISAYSQVQNQPAIPINSFGIWDRGGVLLKDPTNAKYNKFFKGSQLDMKWKDLQPTDSATYNWTVFDTNLKVAHDNNVQLYLTLYVGPDCPEWIYTAGKVPAVTTNDTKHSWPKYPYYLNPNYSRLWHKMIAAFGKHMRETIALEWNHTIAFLQVVDGCTGDVIPYKGTVDSVKYAISATQYDAFRFVGFSKYKAAFLDGDQNTRIPLLFNGVNEEDTGAAAGWKWVTDSLQEGFGMKSGTTIRGVALNGELKFKNGYSKYFIDPKGLACFGRSEMDNGCMFPLFMKNLDIAYYWAILNGLNTGTSIHDINQNSSDQVFARPEVMKSMLFFNKYAPQVFASQATGAYSVFHKGLNANNPTKYPYPKYSTLTQSNLERYYRICKDEAMYGAKISDTAMVAAGKGDQRNLQKDYNDVGWDIDEGNFERFLTQIAPDSTSAGLWRVRGTLTGTSSKYDRFARRFDNVTNRNTMYFKFWDDVFSSTSKPKSMTVSITWLDSIAGSTWEFRYKNLNGVVQAPLKVTGLGDRNWKTVTTTITDMDVTQSGELHSDFMLVNTDNLDDIFNGIEVDFERMTTGIDDITGDTLNSFQLFPNPVKSSLNWKTNANFDQMRIYSINGVLLVKLSNIESGFINLNHLQRGMYFCQFCKDNQVIQTEKFIKE
jgi:Secretion system C-terminal sorting domain